MSQLKIILTLLFCGYILTYGQNKSIVSEKDSAKLFDSIKFSVSRRFFNNPNECKKDALTLIKIAKTRRQKVEALHLLGYVYDLTGNVDSARYCLENRLKITTKYLPKDKEHYQAVIDYANWGMEYVDCEILVRLLVKNLSNIDNQKFKKEAGLLSFLLGDVFFRDKEYEKARFYYEKCFKNVTSDMMKVDYYEKMADLNIVKNDFLGAKKNIENAIKILNNKTVFVHAHFLRTLGYINYRLLKFTDSRANLNESLKIQKKYQYNNLKSKTYLYLSLLEKENKNTVNEKKYLDSARLSYDGDLLLLKDINFSYADFYSRNNDISRQNTFLDLYETTLDSINNIEKNKAKLKIESLYQLKESQKELQLKQKILDKESLLKKIFLYSSILIFILGLSLFWIYFSKWKTQKKLYKNKYSLHEQELKLMLENQRTEIIKEKIKAKIEERGKLSLELHDGIANEIGALKLVLSDEKFLLKSEIDAIVNKIDKLYNEVRNLSHDLDPDNIADVEFSQLVNNLCLITEKAGIKTNKNILISKDVDDLDESILLNMYRILQEIINNVLKHAEATELDMDVFDTPEEIIIKVKDNGKGILESNSKPGIGLKNIEKRVKMLNGRYEIQNTNNGLSISISIPKSVSNIKTTTP